MTNEEKQLLINDLCARLPYGIIAHALEIDKIGTITDINVSYNAINLTVDNASGKYELVPMSDIKPYLRPMSSMTEEEKEEERKLWDIITITRNDLHYIYTDFLLSHHFDYRGLIEKGLALEAPEGMYNIK
jgi:signal transduction protein with GAF and PtsI domain